MSVKSTSVKSTSVKSKCSVIFSSRASRLPRRELKAFAAALQTEVARGRAFDVLIAGDAELERLNRQFRAKPYPTDVLSFPSEGIENFMGEIAISEARAATQAEELGHSKDCEIRILMLHGVLHLAGMDHEKDNGAMARAERRWRKHFSLPAGLIERAQA
jgi:probable rRNA maturation factor